MSYVQNYSFIEVIDVIFKYFKILDNFYEILWNIMKTARKKSVDSV